MGLEDGTVNAEWGMATARDAELIVVRHGESVQWRIGYSLLGRAKAQTEGRK
jgi:hypothetical protein